MASRASHASRSSGHLEDGNETGIQDTMVDHSLLSRVQTWSGKLFI